ncbi:hypothetical protein BDP27DRAFT_1422527 [Rhodocollybia butyracea]|uniref:Uncharacterized protein n=1 Tax=Rhodocollybia butyracea TaxID=206335 RepID=A0A9P5PR09_9AGAR|nr:hypothetical protein BDP27DRAFT_1422527 [Rhodocollybia butyracea]
MADNNAHMADVNDKTPTQPTFSAHDYQPASAGPAGSYTTSSKSPSPNPSASSSRGTSKRRKLEEMLSMNFAKFQSEMIESNRQSMQQMISLNTETLASVSATMTTNFNSVTTTQSTIAQTLSGVATTLNNVNHAQSATARSLLNLEERLNSQPSFRGRTDTRERARRKEEKGKEKETEVVTPMEVDSGDPDPESGGAWPESEEEPETDDGAGNDADSEESGKDDTWAGVSKKKKVKNDKEKKAENAFKMDVCDWLHELVGGRQYSLLATVSDREANNFAKEFKQNPLACPCGIADFRYCVDRKPACPWNKGAAYVFADYVEKRRFMKVSGKKQRDRLRAAFATRMHSLVCDYKESQRTQEEQLQKERLNNKRTRKTTHLTASVLVPGVDL